MDNFINIIAVLVSAFIGVCFVAMVLSGTIILWKMAFGG